MGEPSDLPAKPPCTDAKYRARTEMEQQVIGSILKFPACFYEAAKILSAEDFHHYSHQAIFSAVTALRARGAPADVPAVFDELVKTDKVLDAGNAVYLQELYEKAISVSSVDYYARQIREQAVLDSMQRALLRHAELIRLRKGDARDLIAEAEKEVFDVSRAASGVGKDGKMIGLIVDQVYDLISRRAAGECHGIPTGLTDLDDVMAGLHPQHLVVIASRPSVGKTAVACNLIKSACHNGHLTLLFSLEMSEEEIGERLICLESGTNSHDIRIGALNDADIRRIQSAGSRIRQWPLKVNDSPCMRVSQIASACRREGNNGLGLVIVDYLQLIEPENRKHSRQEQVAGFSRGLKQLAKSLSVPVVALAQLNRESEQRANQRPKMSDLRESGAIEADADEIILLHRTPDQPGRLELLVVKQRNGPNMDVSVRYEPEFYRLSDL